MREICLGEAFYYYRFKTFKEQEICVHENSYYIHMKWSFFYPLLVYFPLEIALGLFTLIKFFVASLWLYLFLDNNSLQSKMNEWLYA